MNKSDFVKAVAEKTGQTVKASSDSVNAMISILSDEMAKGNTITFVGFGSFGRKIRNARTGKNPQTNEPLVIPEKKIPFFKAGSQLKAHIAE